ncbi:MAG TPA: hypothetical protein VFP71_11610 [Candidatus Angelobacter sp.]|nr:hypothetical protein [Candidatus Angelobacter sp.]
MTQADLDLLKNSANKVVRIFCHNGETMLAKVHFVSEEDRDLIYDLIATTTESQYEKHDEQPAYLIGFEHIKRVEPMSSS